MIFLFDLLPKLARWSQWRVTIQTMQMIRSSRRLVILTFFLSTLLSHIITPAESSNLFLRRGGNGGDDGDVGGDSSNDKDNLWHPFHFFWNLIQRRNHNDTDDDDNDNVDDETLVMTTNRLEDADMFGHSVFFESQQHAMKDAGKIANIIGGNDATSTEAPWFVMLLTWNDDDQEWKYYGCGGTLISDRHVLTAAHCLEGRDQSKDGIYVHAYQPFLGNPGVDYHFSKVKTYTLHPDFDDGPNWSDVAIITMKTPTSSDVLAADFGGSVVVPAHPSIEMRDGDMHSIYGFGRMKETDSSLVNTLQTASLYV